MFPPGKAATEGKQNQDLIENRKHISMCLCGRIE